MTGLVDAELALAGMQFAVAALCAWLLVKIYGELRSRRRRSQ